MKYLLGVLILVAFGGGLFLVWQKENNVEISNLNLPFSDSSAAVEEPPKPLANPPKIIKAIYLTGWTAGTESRLKSLIELVKSTELNSMVIDIKDYSGYVDYDMALPEVEKYNAEEIKISDINALVKKLHNEEIYVIARISVFQDPVLAKARPDLAIKNENTGGLWLDNKKLAWIDPAAKDAWDYNIAIAKETAGHGFDEINFDYIRFASDGNLKSMSFPFWDGQTPKQEVIKNFFKYLREQMPEIKISADLFGLATVQSDDLGIGQIIEDAYPYFDFVCPMTYPSHYSSGFLNYKNPAAYPYEVVKYSMENALRRLITYNSPPTTIDSATSTAATSTPTQSLTVNPQSSAKLRPWLQDFDLGADYNALMVKKQIQAVYDAASATPELVSGWFLWNPSNVYTRGALEIINN